MACPHCAATTTRAFTKPTQLGYQIFRCAGCARQFNERTRTLYNYLEFPTDIVLLVVLWRLRYQLRLRDLAEMFLERGFECTHEAVREWETRFAPLLSEQLRARRKGETGHSWHTDETYIKVAVRGSTCTGPSIAMAISSTRCYVNTAIWTRPSASLRGL